MESTARTATRAVLSPERLAAFRPPPPPAPPQRRAASTRRLPPPPPPPAIPLAPAALAAPAAPGLAPPTGFLVNAIGAVFLTLISLLWIAQGDGASVIPVVALVGLALVGVNVAALRGLLHDTLLVPAGTAGGAVVAFVLSIVAWNALREPGDGVLAAGAGPTIVTALVLGACGVFFFTLERGED